MIIRGVGMGIDEEFDKRCDMMIETLVEIILRKQK
jgi:hypothetical protein